MSENTTTPMATDQRKFWCHQCRMEINPKMPEFACPACGNDFIEEVEEQEHPQTFRLINDPPQPQAPPQFTPPPFNQQQFVPPPLNPFDLLQQLFLGQPPIPRPPINVNVNVNAFAQPPFVFPTQQFFVHTTGGPNPFDMMFQQLFGGFPMGGGGAPGQHGDYVFDGNFDQVLNRLWEMAARDHRRRPAPKEAVDSQKSLKINQEHVDNKEECAICKDEYQLDEEVMQLGCKHLFHPECVKRWLGMSSSCPVCRWEIKELPKEDNNNNGGGGSDDHMSTDNSSDSASSFYI